MEGFKAKRRQKTDASEWEEDNEDIKEEVSPSIDAGAGSIGNSTQNSISNHTNETDVDNTLSTNNKNYQEIRNISRQRYLKEREKVKVGELEAQLAQYSERTDLSHKEIQDFNHKQKIYDILKQTEISAEQEYELPEDYINESGKIDKKRKLAALNLKQEPKDRAISTKKHDKTHSNHHKNQYENQWEKDQLRKAESISKTTTDDIVVNDDKEYEYVFDESQFVQFDTDKLMDNNEEIDPDPVPPPSKTDSHSGKIEDTRKALPVYGYRESFLEAVKENQILVVVGETGSGKTTQLPQYLYEAGYCENKQNPDKVLKIGCTQPRRVAATSVATRVADEVGVPIGQQVGYSIRFEDKTSEQTVIKYLTDGILLREFLNDPILSGYSALMIDEAHERTISTEILLSLLKDIARERTDLRIIVASATINAQKFSDFFDGAPVFNIPGRRYPVDIHYTQQPEANYIQAAINTIFLIHSKKSLPGDILVFLTGQDEIETMQENLLEATEKLGSLINDLIICPIYANLPYEYQKKIFEPTSPNARKVVLATNIAETSITIDGIKYVIDCGYVKENVYNPSTGMDSLVVVPCSKASADQRAGRAGRVGPGECFRLYTKWSFNNELLTNPTPEILRGNLTSTVLLLLSLGITDLINFDFMDPPSSETLIKCLELLYAIGALNSKGELTRTGRRMAEFPIEPMFSKCLLESCKFGVMDEVVAVIAMLGESANLFFRPKDKKIDADKKREFFNDSTGDHLTLLKVWSHWTDTEYSSLWCQENFIQYRTLKRVKDVKDQLQLLCKKVGITVENDQEVVKVDENLKSMRIQKSIVAGFFPHVVRLSRMGDSYRTLKKNQSVYIHPSSAIYHLKPPPKLILYHELVLTSKEYMRNCMVIDDKWLQELAPHYYNAKELESLNVKNTSRRYK